MNKFRMINRVILAGIVILLCSCDGGGGVAGTVGGGGIGGTGLTSSGTIDAFGSIFVNGVEYETDSASIFLDGEAGDESLLGLGMVVLVTGTVNEDGVTGSADSVTFDDDVQGPVSTIDPGPDGDTSTLTVLNLSIVVDRTATVFDGVTFDGLSTGDLVEISGFIQVDGKLSATRLEKKEDFAPGQSEIEIKGVVENLTPSEFNLGAFVVDYSSADLSEVPGGALSEGMPVEVEGTLEGLQITASAIEEEEELSSDFEDDEEIEVSGAISNFSGDGSFLVNGTPVDASSASLSPEDLILADGLIVKTKGRWNGSVLVAEEVELRSGGGASGEGDVEVHARVASVSSAQSSITLQLFSGTVTVLVDSQTQMEDKTEVVNPLTLDDLAAGDFLKVQGVLSGESFIAVQLDRTEVEKDRLQAPVESFELASSITLFGITYSTVGAEFENANDQAISEAEFYGALQVGDLVKIEDELTPDGIADEVEFEDD